MLTELNHVPEGFEDCSPENLQSVLSGPTLIHIEGRRKEPLFVSVLLHGNEPTGLLAIQLFLKKNHGKTLPRSISIFIGNVTAAMEGARHLEQQPDYNRIWPCQDCHLENETDNQDDTPEHAMMKTIVDTMREKNVFTSIDIHNNTGLNPHYGCINRLDHRFFHLATLFSRTVVYFIRPKGVQSMAFADICPSVTVECGKPDQAYGATHAADFINTCLHLSDLPSHPVAAHDMDLFHTVATVTVPEHIKFSFSDKNINMPADIYFSKTLDHLNFTELAAGTSLGSLDANKSEIPLRVTDEHGQDATNRYLTLEASELRITRQVMPSMFTLDEKIIRQDCLGYLMERMDWKSHST